MIIINDMNSCTTNQYQDAFNIHHIKENIKSIQTTEISPENYQRNP